MCGICGQYDYSGKKIIPEERLKRMTQSIVHRGPDDEGFYHSTHGYAAGFRRLSIIDLGGGHQPMSDVDGRIWLVFNGEIFNFPALRRELESKGHVFRTNSDTEVIIHGYREWGDEVLQRLNGMFGFALWDDHKQRLLLARDRMGIKIIYYALKDGILTFGSELRAVRAGLVETPTVSPIAVNLFLRYRYTPSPHTIYENIKKLAPGTCLVVEGGNAVVKRWWNYRPKVNHAMSEKTAIDTLEGLYRESMERHLLSDVPVGILLSGGMDSALMLSLMNRSGSGWKAFSVGFGSGYRDDELADARRTSELLGAEFNEIRIDREAFEESLPEVIRFLEEPIASASIVPMYHVCRRASREVKVAMIGQGPDELFGGYTRHLGLRYGSYWRGIPPFIRSPLKAGLSHIPGNETIKRSLYSLDRMDRMSRYQNTFSVESGNRIDALFKQDLLRDNPGDEILTCWQDLFPLMEETGELGGFQFLEVRSSLPDELLMYSDKLSMAHSIELRVPYLDKEIVEFAETVPDDIKMKWWSRKLLHKKVAARFLPEEIISRRKRAFSSNVVDEWFKSSLDGKMANYILDPESRMYQFLEHNAVTSILKEHRNGSSNNYKLLFSLIVFEEWLRQ